MKGNIIKKGNRCFMELPAEFANYDEIEMFRLRDGFYLLALPLEEGKKRWVAKAAAAGEEGITAEEKDVISKLLSVRFDQRTPANVARILSPKEIEVLKMLERKGFVNVFVGKKYAGGVYNINDRIFSILQSQRAKRQETEEKPQKQEAQSPTDELGRKGYLVLGEKEALGLMSRIRDRVKRGELRGLKGFDNNYYLINSKFFAESSRKILKALDKEKGISEIAKATKMDEEAIKAVLNFLAESGEVIEKRKGVYAAV